MTTIMQKLAAHRAEVVALEKRATKLANAEKIANKRQTQAAALEEKVMAHYKKVAAATLASLMKGKRDLPVDERRELDAEKESIEAASDENAFDIDALPAMLEQIETEKRYIGDEYARLRVEGRALAVEHFKEVVLSRIDKLDSAELRLQDIPFILDNIRDHVAASEAFRNGARPGSQVSGVIIEKMPNGNVDERLDFTNRDTVANQVGAEEVFKRWAPVVGTSFRREPDQAQLRTITDELVNFYRVPAYTRAEREAEWTLNISPCTRHSLDAFKASPEQFRPIDRNRWEATQAEIDAAALRLGELQRAPF